MTTYRNYNFASTKVTAMAVDIWDLNRVWIAFAQDDDGYCWVKKVSANDLFQTFYAFRLSVDEVTDIHQLDEDYIYFAVDDATALFFVTDPQFPTPPDPTEVAIPAGITEAPISIKDDGTYIYLLFPGNLSGTNAKICKYNNTSLITTIQLTTVTNAVGMTIDGTDIWVVTGNSPSELVRVYDSGGYTYTTTQLVV